MRFVIAAYSKVAVRHNRMRFQFCCFSTWVWRRVSRKRKVYVRAGIGTDILSGVWRTEENAQILSENDLTESYL